VEKPIDLGADATERELYHRPLTDNHGPTGYWGWVCEVPFEHSGRRVTHRGLVVLSGPMRTALRRTRAQHLHALFAALQEVQTKIGTSVTAPRWKSSGGPKHNCAAHPWASWFEWKPPQCRSKR